MNELHTQLGLKIALDEISRQPVRRARHPRRPRWRPVRRLLRPA